MELGPDAHYGSDPAMGRDLAAHLLEGAPFPVQVHDAMVAGLTVMDGRPCDARGNGGRLRGVVGEVGDGDGAGMRIADGARSIH